MNVSGGLNYVVGPMGSGKSYYAVRRIVRAITEQRRYAITNVRLLPDSFERIGRHYAHGSKRKAALIAARAEAMYVYETDLEEAMRYRVPGRGEGRALFVWDETHNDLNNRSWRSDGRGLILEWATQLRKLGFVGFLLSQHRDNTDAQLRRVCNNIVALQNQRERTRLLGVRVTPWPLFLACWYPAHLALSSGGGTAPKPDAIERYLLGWYRRLYDTHDLYHGLDVTDEDSRVIWLPEGGRCAPKGLPAPSQPHEIAAVAPDGGDGRTGLPGIALATTGGASNAA